MVPEIRYQIDWFSEGQRPLSESYFQLEKSLFLRIAACPQSYSGFLKKYSGMTFAVSTALSGVEVVGFKLSEQITREHYHHHIIAVNNSCRGRGIGRKLGEMLLEEIINCGCKYITLFSVPESTKLDIEGSRCRLLSKDQELLPCEVELLNNLEGHSLLPQPLPKSRINKNHYKYRDATTGEALLKCFKVNLS